MLRESARYCTIVQFIGFKNKAYIYPTNILIYTSLKSFILFP